MKTNKKDQTSAELVVTKCENAVSAIVDTGVSKNDIIDMVINEEITKAEAARVKLLEQQQASRTERDTLRTTIEKVIASVAFFSSVKEAMVTLKRLKITLPKNLEVCFDIDVLDIAQYAADNRVMERSDRDRRNRMHGGGFFYHPMELLMQKSLLPNEGSIVAYFVDSKKMPEVNSENKFVDTRLPGFEHTLTISVPVPKFDFKDVTKMKAKLKQLEEAREELNLKLNRLENDISEIKNKKEQIKSGLTRMTLGSTEEGKEILADLEKIKTKFGVSFNASLY